MASAVLVSVEDYLNTSYDPDCEYVDGEIVERNLGEKKHSKAQLMIIYFPGDHYPPLRDRIYPEQRVQVKGKSLPHSGSLHQRRRCAG